MNSGARAPAARGGGGSAAVVAARRRWRHGELRRPIPRVWRVVVSVSSLRLVSCVLCHKYILYLYLYLYLCGSFWFRRVPALIDPKLCRHPDLASLVLVVQLVFLCPLLLCGVLPGAGPLQMYFVLVAIAFSAAPSRDCPAAHFVRGGGYTIFDWRTPHTEFAHSAGPTNMWPMLLLCGALGCFPFSKERIGLDGRYFKTSLVGCMNTPHVCMRVCEEPKFSRRARSLVQKRTGG